MIADKTVPVDFESILAAAPETPGELAELGQKIGEFIMQAVGKADAQRERSQQSERRHLGMSELGGCREYIRASVAGDPKGISDRVKWPAFVGTEVGDGVEAAVGKIEPRVATQQDVVVTLSNGMQIMGHDDIEFGRRRLVDLKTKDGTDEIREKGAPFKEKVQVAGYLTGLIQAGKMDADATAHLVYLDRSGRDREAFVVSMTAQEALGWLAAAEERIEDVARALASGQSQGALRDQPESWCFHTQCPFYQACWGGEEYNPSTKLDPMFDDALRMYDDGRAMKKAAENLIRNAKSVLNPEPGNDDLLVSGVGSEFRIKWTLTERNGWVSPSIDVRAL